jgi:hypothetical protein
VLDTRASAHPISDEAELLISRRKKKHVEPLRGFTCSMADLCAECAAPGRALGRETNFPLRACSPLRQCDRDFVEAHRIFKDELIERLFP